MFDARYVGNVSRLARRNIAQYAPDDRAQFDQVDVMQWLEQQTGDRLWDIIVCDPPTFSNSKRMKRDWQVQRDHPWLLCLWTITAPGGICYFSNNFRGFKLAESGLPSFDMQELTPASIPNDFRNKRIHRCWQLTKPHSG